MNLKTFSFVSRSESDTDAFGKLLAELLPNGAVVALCGTLGAGKTRLVQAVAVASGISGADVSSPTFVLVHEYDQGKRPIYHFDVYRLDREADFFNLGPEEYFDSEGISFVEWADKMPGILPEDHIAIQIEISDERTRIFRLETHGSRYQRFFAQIMEKNT